MTLPQRLIDALAEAMRDAISKQTKYGPGAWMIVTMDGGVHYQSHYIGIDDLPGAFARPDQAEDLEQVMSAVSTFDPAREVVIIFKAPGHVVSIIEIIGADGQPVQRPANTPTNPGLLQ